MSGRPASARDRPPRLGPGRLIAVIGPSGAGKDTLIDLARAGCADDSAILFPRRVVTRAASRFENNAQLSPEEFRRAREQGAFALHWEAHGHLYGVPRAIDDEIREGRRVIVNLSRRVIASCRGRYADVRVVLVTAPPEVLAERLAARSRGSDGALAERLFRDVEEVAADVTINNVGNAADRGRELLRIIRGD